MMRFSNERQHRVERQEARAEYPVRPIRALAKIRGGVQRADEEEGGCNAQHELAGEVQEEPVSESRNARQAERKPDDDSLCDAADGDDEGAYSIGWNEQR